MSKKKKKSEEITNSSILSLQPIGEIIIGIFIHYNIRKRVD